MQKLSFYISLLVFITTPAHAYIGPGAGAGTIAIVLGVIASILLAFVGIVWYPLKRLLKSRKKAPTTTDTDTDTPSDSE